MGNYVKCKFNYSLSPNHCDDIHYIPTNNQIIKYFYSNKCYFCNLIGTFFLNKPVAANMSFCISQELPNHKSKLFYDSHLHFIY